VTNIANASLSRVLYFLSCRNASKPSLPSLFCWRCPCSRWRLRRCLFAMATTMRLGWQRSSMVTAIRTPARARHRRPTRMPRTTIIRALSTAQSSALVAINTIRHLHAAPVATVAVRLLYPLPGSRCLPRSLQPVQPFRQSHNLFPAMCRTA
jgi:hypothetical protein